MHRPMLLVTFFAALAFAQTNPAALAARQWRQQHERAIVDEFFSLLALPNVSRDAGNIQSRAKYGILPGGH